MRIKSDFMLRKAGSGYVVAAVRSRAKEFHGTIHLNDSGAFLWQQLVEGCSEEELITRLRAEYDATEEQASSDISRFLGVLRQYSLLEE